MRHEEGPRARGANSESVRAGHNESTGQLDIFAAIDTDDGARLRDEGMRIAAHATDVRVTTSLDRVIRDRAATGIPFSSDDVRREVEPLASPNVLGARISAAARRGEIRHVGFVKSERPEAHGRWIMQWVGAEVGR